MTAGVTTYQQIYAEHSQKAAIENRLNMEIGSRMAEDLVALHIWLKRVGSEIGLTYQDPNTINTRLVRKQMSIGKAGWIHANHVLQTPFYEKKILNPELEERIEAVIIKYTLLHIK